MPMYDWNGTTGSELGKAYDWDGTTSHQLGKGYDWDGTSNHLIYTANAPETATILNYSDQVSGITGGWKLGNKGGYAYSQGWSSGDNAWVMRYSGNNWSGAGFMQTTNKFNISGYSKLHLEYDSKQGYGDATKSNGWVYIALVPNASGSGDNASGYCGGTPSNRKANGFNNDNPVVAYNQRESGNITDWSIDLDVSNIDGEYYVQIGRYNSDGYGTFSTFFKTLTFVE